VAPVTIIDNKVYAMPWFIMPAFWYVWRDLFEKNKVKLPSTYEEAKAAAHALNRPSENFYGMGQSWNRTSDGYGVMQSLMYSYGQAGQIETASIARSRRPPCSRP